MANDKNKLIDNYSLEELKQVYPNQTELWNARHIILKKVFTVKKLKYRETTTPNDANDSALFPRPLDQYEKLLNQTNLLKRLNDQYAPKCYKLIKTSNNVYLIYEQFPSLTLNEYLARHPLSRHEKNTLLQNLALAVLKTHKKKIGILNLNQDNVYIRNKLQVFFGDWTLSRQIGNLQTIKLNHQDSQNQFMATEVKQNGQCGLPSDIYSLGKIFKIVQKNTVKEANSSFRMRLQTLITKMTKSNYKQRPNIKQVLKAIRPKQVDTSTHKTQKSNSPSLSSISDLKVTGTLKLRLAETCQEPSINNIIGSRIKRRTSVQKHFSQKDLDSTKCNLYELLPNSQKLATKQTSKYLQTKLKNPDVDNASLLSKKKSSPPKYANQYQSLAQPRARRTSQLAQSQYKIARRVSKARNLCFLLVDLAEFVIGSSLNNPLGYILLKYSYLFYRQNLYQWKSQKINTAQGKQLTEILQKEITFIHNAMLMIKLKLNVQAHQSVALKKQIDIEYLINDKYLKQKVIQFAKEVVINCEKNQLQGIFQAQPIDVLFKTYLILKKVQDQSYQKFWDKVSNGDSAYLSNQKYLKGQKDCGFRYLKSRIAEILSKR